MEKLVYVVGLQVSVPSTPLPAQKPLTRHSGKTQLGRKTHDHSLY